MAGTGCRHGTDADGENGPATRSFAADAHDCIMVRFEADRPHTSLWRERCALMASSPRIITQTDAVTRPGLEDKLISLFSVPPRSRASRRCETRATLRWQAAKLC